MSRRSPKAFRKPIIGACLAALLVAVAIAASAVPAAGARAKSSKSTPCGESTYAPRRLTLRQMQTSEICLINRVRSHYGLHPLLFNADLRNSALAHSVSMVVHDYFAHEGPGGTMDNRIARAGYIASAGSFAIGEDIGGGGGRRWGSPMAVLKSWMHSPPHRENILNPRFRDVGIGVARGYPIGRPKGAATYTADFGARSN